MILASVEAGTSDRIRHNLILLQHILKIENHPEIFSEEVLKMQKGLFFVSLYSCIEYTLTNTASEFLTALQGNIKPCHQYKPNLLTILLNREFSSLANSPGNWATKEKLITAIFSSNHPTIDNSTFPAPGTNIAEEHFESIWHHCGLSTPVFPENFSKFILHEIKNHRNAIAHGRETASSIGSRFTTQALSSRHTAIEELCRYTIFSFEQHLINNHFLKAR